MKKRKKGSPGYLDYKKKNGDSSRSDLFFNCCSNYTTGVQPDSY